MKRLVAAGARRIFQIARAFRGGERGPHHQPEFTIVEWYRAERRSPPSPTTARPGARGRPSGGALPAPWRCRPARRAAAHPAGPALRAHHRRASCCARHAGIELDRGRGRRSCWPRRPARRGGARGWRAPGTTSSSSSSSTGSSRGWAASGRPSCSTGRCRWPPWRAASPTIARLAERFELYAGGLELANAFGELTDPRAARALRGRGGACAAQRGQDRLSARREAARGAGPHAAHRRGRAGLRPPGHARCSAHRHPRRASPSPTTRSRCPAVKSEAWDPSPFGPSLTRRLDLDPPLLCVSRP